MPAETEEQAADGAPQAPVPFTVAPDCGAFRPNEERRRAGCLYGLVWGGLACRGGVDGEGSGFTLRNVSFMVRVLCLRMILTWMFVGLSL